MAYVIEYTDLESFTSIAIPFLVAHEAENNLPLGIIASIRAGEYADPAPYLATVESTDGVQAILVRTPPHRLLISYPPQEFSLETVEAIVDAVSKKFAWELTGVTADTRIARAVADKWKETQGTGISLESKMQIYSLTQVVDAERTMGVRRRIEARDRKLVVGWLSDFHRDVHGESTDTEQFEEQVTRGLNAEPEHRGLYLWEVDGFPVSLAGYSGPTANGIRVGPVYTPPRHRGKGYASALVADLSAELLDSGRQFCFLFTDLSNPTSNHIYQDIGYEPVSRVDTWKFLPV